MLKIKIVAAVAANGVIGREGRLPWELPDDLRWFKKVTGKSPLLMGRKTFTSIIGRNGKPLPGRENIVLTRNSVDLKVDGVTVTNDFRSVMDRARNEEIFVIGGEEIYRLALPVSKMLVLTRVHAVVEGDAFFPEWDPEDWRCTHSERHGRDARHKYSFTWQIYVRRPR